VGYPLTGAMRRPDPAKASETATPRQRVERPQPDTARRLHIAPDVARRLHIAPDVAPSMLHAGARPDPV
jgi:hypothetical protein